MIKVSSESHFVVLSGRREKVKSDSAVRSELGWGSHTMEYDGNFNYLSFYYLTRLCVMYYSGPS